MLGEQRFQPHESLLLVHGLAPSAERLREYPTAGFSL
jgi:hypothetical protein